MLADDDGTPLEEHGRQPREEEVRVDEVVPAVEPEAAHARRQVPRRSGAIG